MDFKKRLEKRLHTIINKLKLKHEDVKLEDIVNSFADTGYKDSFQNKNPQGNIKEYISFNVKKDPGYSISVTLIKDKQQNVSFFCDIPPETTAALLIHIKSESLKWITKKHPNIFKSLISKNLQFNSNVESFYNDILNFRAITKDKTHKDIYWILMSNDDLQKNFLKHMIGLDANSSFDVLKLLNNTRPETFLDFFQNIKQELKIQTFIKKATTVHQRYLFENKSVDYIREIIRLDIDIKQFKNEFSKKILKFDTPEKLEQGLKSYLNTKHNFSMEHWVNKLDDLNIHNYTQDDNLLIIETKTFDEMSQIGSPAWCIATDEYHFNTYTDDYNRQYMILNFDLDIDDQNSMIGITVDTHGKVTNSHDKNDRNLYNDPILNKYKKYTPALSKDGLGILINEKNIKATKHTNHTLFSLYEKYSIHNIDTNLMDDCKHKLIDIYKNNPDLFHENIDELFYRNTPEDNNITETVQFLLDYLDPGDFEKFFFYGGDKIQSFKLMNYETENVLKDEFLKFSTNDFQLWEDIKRFNRTIGKDKSLYFTKKLYEKDPEKFWDTVLMDTDVSTCATYFVGIDDWFEVFQDKNIPIDILANGLFLEHNTYLVKEFYNKTSDDIKKATIKVTLDSGQIELATTLNKDCVINKAEAIELLESKLFGNNDSHVIHYFKLIKDINRENPILDGAKELLITKYKNIKIDEINNDLIRDSEIRIPLLKNKQITEYNYARFSIDEKVIDKDGVKTVLEIISNPDNRSMLKRDRAYSSEFGGLGDLAFQKISDNLDIEMDEFIETSLDNNYITKKEVKIIFKDNKNLLSPHIKSLISENSFKPRKI